MAGIAKNVALDEKTTRTLITDALGVARNQDFYEDIFNEKQSPNLTKASKEVSKGMEQKMRVDAGEIAKKNEGSKAQYYVKKD